MLDLDTQELLSGLVDGQLSPAESERARQLLADDASCRQYYEELVALRESLKTLARVSAPAGLADGVRERLHGTLPRPAGLAGADGAAGEALDGRPMRERHRWARPAVWSLLAVAAAVLVMLTSGPELTDERELALREAAPEAPSLAVAPVDARDAADGLGRGAAGSDDPREPDAAGGVGRSDVASREAAPLARTAPARTMAKSRRAGEAAEPATVGDEAVAPAGGAAPAAPMSAAALAAEPAVMVDGEALPLLVVQCDLSARAMDEGAFRRALSAAAIDWDESPLPLGEDLPGHVAGEGRAETEAEVAASEDAAARPAGAAIVPDTGPEGQVEQSREGVAAAVEQEAGAVDTEAGEVELVYVEAAPEQLQSMLAMLQQGYGGASNVMVEPATASIEVRQQWQQYNSVAPAMEEASTAEPLAGRAANRAEPADAERVESAEAVPSATAAETPRNEQDLLGAGSGVDHQAATANVAALQDLAARNAAQWSAETRRRAVSRNLAGGRAQRVELRGRNRQWLSQQVAGAVNQGAVNQGAAALNEAAGVAREAAAAALAEPTDEALPTAEAKPVGEAANLSAGGLQQAVFVIRVMPAEAAGP